MQEIINSDETDLTNENFDEKEFIYHLIELYKKKEQNVRMQPNDDDLISVNLGTHEEPKEVKIIRSTMSTLEQSDFLVLREFVDVFAWSYADMPGINVSIVMHEIYIPPEIKQRLRKLLPE